LARFSALLRRIIIKLCPIRNQPNAACAATNASTSTTAASNPTCATWKKTTRALVTAGKKDEAKKALPGVHSVLDKAVKSGVLTRPTVNRKKSRLAAALN